MREMKGLVGAIVFGGGAFLAASYGFGTLVTGAMVGMALICMYLGWPSPRKE